MLVFPTKNEEIQLILNLKYDEIRSIVNRKIEEFFKIYEEISLLHHTSDIRNYVVLKPLNQIFKKILLENNRINNYSSHNIFSNVALNSKSRIIIFSDALNNEEFALSFFEYDQKLIFLMKRQNITIDCLSISEEKIVKIYIFNCYI